MFCLETFRFITQTIINLILTESLGLRTHLFVKVPRPGESGDGEVTLSVFGSSLIYFINLIQFWGSDDKGIDPWMTKASKILISFHLLTIKAQLRLKSFDSYHNCFELRYHVTGLPHNYQSFWGSDDRGINTWTTKASKILISFIH